MRLGCRAVLGLIVAVAPAGCNEIFGLTSTTGRDGPPAIDAPFDAPFPHIALTLQVSTVTATGTPGPLEFPPIDPAPVIEAVRSLAAAVPLPYGPDGGIVLPFDVPDDKWRLVYTLADGIPHELQRTADQMTHITIPQFGRVDRAAPPASSGYRLTPGGFTGPYTAPKVFTTGLWTQPGGPVGVPPGATLDYPISSAVSLSGPNGAPETARGDRQVLIDYATPPSTCNAVAIGAGVSALDLIANMLTPGAPVWHTQTQTHSVQVETLDVGNRMVAAMGSLYDSSASTFHEQFGYIPTQAMPSFTQRIFGTPFPAPLMLVLADCPNQPQTPSPFVDPPELAGDLGMTGAFYGYFAARRAIGPGFPTVTSGMQIVSVPPQQVKYIAPLSASVALGSLQLTGNGTSDHAPYTLPASFDELTFTQESGGNVAPADYFTVTLYKLVGATLAAVRIYTVTRPLVRIDSSVLESGSEYIFQIDAVVGVPGAAAGDFATIAYPMAMTTVFTRTFKP